MQDGFIKVAAGTPEIRVADCAYNAQACLSLLHQAAAEGVKVLCLPELCLTGYTCGDLFLQDALLQGAEDALRSLLEGSKDLDLLGGGGGAGAVQPKALQLRGGVLPGGAAGPGPEDPFTQLHGVLRRALVHLRPGTAGDGLLHPLCGAGERGVFCGPALSLRQRAVVDDRGRDLRGPVGGRSPLHPPGPRGCDAAFEPLRQR